MANERNAPAYAELKFNPQVPQAANIPDEPFVVKLDGKLITSENPMEISKNFRSIVNMRYKNSHPEGVLGMSALSAAIPTYTKIRAAYHFQKRPVVTSTYESHVLVQAYNSAMTASRVFDNQTAIPGSGNFDATATWTDSSGAQNGIFSSAPNGHVAYCNGVDACIWSGVHTYCAAFVLADAALAGSLTTLSSPRDMTERVNNALTDEFNSVTVGSGNDGYTTLLIHADDDDGTGEDDIVDSSSQGHVITAAGSAQVSHTQARFGPGSILFSGAGDSLTVATTKRASWSFGTGEATIDTWIRPVADGKFVVCGQELDANNYWHLSAEMDSLFAPGGGSVGTITLTLKAVVGGSTIADYEFLGFAELNEWTHIMWGRKGANMYAFVNGAVATAVVTTAIAATAMPDFDAVLLIGGGDEGDLDGYMDEFRVSKGICRHVAAFTPFSSAYHTAQRTIFLGSTRPASGARLYFSGTNGEAASLSLKEFNGVAWQDRDIVTDCTATGSAAFAKDGLVSWGSTVSSAKQVYMEGYYLYWYALTLSAGSANIYHCSLDVPFQHIIDVWDGYYRKIAACFVQRALAKHDETLPLREYEYNEDDKSSYIGLSIFNSTIEIGFTEKMTGLFFAIPSERESGTAANMTIAYWDGESYTSVGVLSDGTKEGTGSFSSGGVVAWANKDLLSEAKRSIKGGPPYYYYRVTFSGVLGLLTRLYYIGGIPAPQRILDYSFPLHAADRLMLGGGTKKEQNALLISGQGAVDVMNGDDSFKIFFGDAGVLTCACSIFTQYAANVYNFILVFKATEVWSLLWDQTSEGTSWSRYNISPTIGCPAPRTLQVASVAFEANLNQTKVVAMWRGNDGIYVSNGQAPFEVSKDIASVFDQSSDLHVNLSMINEEVAFFDKKRLEYHWLWASGDSTSLDKEYVLDTIRWKWFEIDRATGNRLQFGVDVITSVGNYYIYGFLDTGIMYQLEAGTTFNGTAIACKLHFGDQLLTEYGVFAETEIVRANLIMSTRNTDSDVMITHYLDGEPTGTEYTLSSAHATRAYTNVLQDIYSRPAVFHGLKIEATSDSETKPFEPLHLALAYQRAREHTR